jgi:hypothetical protein
MTIQPEGENLRNAVKWISEKRKESPDTPLSKLIAEAGARFNLSPKDAEFLARGEAFS